MHCRRKTQQKVVDFVDFGCGVLPHCSCFNISTFQAVYERRKGKGLVEPTHVECRCSVPHHLRERCKLHRSVRSVTRPLGICDLIVIPDVANSFTVSSQPMISDSDWNPVSQVPSFSTKAVHIPSVHRDQYSTGSSSKSYGLCVYASSHVPGALHGHEGCTSNMEKRDPKGTPQRHRWRWGARTSTGNKHPPQHSRGNGYHRSRRAGELFNGPMEVLQMR